jgi:tryptophan 2-C-methyltransferase
MSAPKVILINYNRLIPPVAPIALDYLGSALEEAGIKPFLADLVWADEPYRFLEEAIAKNGPFVLAAVTVRNIDDSSFLSRKFFLPEIRELVGWLKQECSLPVVLGGCGFSIMPGEVLQYCGADYGVWGDGEDTLAHLANRLHRGREITSLPGLLYHNQGQVKYNPPRYVSLPEKEYLSKRSLVDNHLYFVRGGQGNLETKRGCSGSCIYCADPLARGEKQRLRPAQHVVEEFKNLICQGIDCFHLCDTEFNRPPSHAEEICRALINSGISKKISWYAYCSPEPFSRELAFLMKEAGCAGINFGVDSANEEMLSRLGRNHDRSSLKSIARYCHQNRLPFMVDLLIGAPGENRKTITESIDFVKSLEPTAAGISLGVRLYRGTPLAQMLSSLDVSDTCLRGHVPENENFLQPVYYLSPGMGEGIHQYLNELTGDDPRFFSLADPRADRDYSYTENQVLMEAIEKGYRGAYWHILQKLQHF